MRTARFWADVNKGSAIGRESESGKMLGQSAGSLSLVGQTVSRYRIVEKLPTKNESRLDIVPLSEVKWLLNTPITRAV